MCNNYSCELRFSLVSPYANCDGKEYCLNSRQSLVVYNDPCLLVVHCDTPVFKCRFISRHVPSAIHPAGRTDFFALLSEFLLPTMTTCLCTDASSRLTHVPTDIAPHDLDPLLSEITASDGGRSQCWCSKDFLQFQNGLGHGGPSQQLSWAKLCSQITFQCEFKLF